MISGPQLDVQTCLLVSNPVRASRSSYGRSLPIAEWERLIAAARLTLHAVESFAKRHDYTDWVARARMSAADREALAHDILAAQPAWQAAFAIERGGDRLIAFADTKTLFVATAP
ncbi:MAG: hypothetical protein ACR2OE_11570 [Thermomicrobiales bacterium]